MKSTDQKDQLTELIKHLPVDDSHITSIRTALLMLATLLIRLEQRLGGELDISLRHELNKLQTQITAIKKFTRMDKAGL